MVLNIVNKQKDISQHFLTKKYAAIIYHMQLVSEITKLHEIWSANKGNDGPSEIEDAGGEKNEKMKREEMTNVMEMSGG